MAFKFNIYINQTPLQQSPIQIKEQSRIKESNFEEEMSILKSQVNPSSSCGLTVILCLSIVFIVPF